MRIGRLAWPLLVLLTLPTMSPMWAHAEDKDEHHEDKHYGDRHHEDRHHEVKDYEEGRAFCPQRALVIGGTIVPAGRCYKLAVLRDRRGTFLAFMDPEVKIRSGKIERLEGEEGRRITNRIFFLVPMPHTVQIGAIPMNTIQLIRLREEDVEDEDAHNREGPAGHSTLIVALPNLPIPNVTVTIVATF